MSAAALGGAGEVLVVEDSPTQAEQLTFLLAEAGHQVITARDGEEALEIVRERRPALVVTDVVMPRMDGYALCRAIKGDPDLRQTPVILLTGLASPDDVIEGLACGADNFVRKPYDPSSLLSRVRRALAGSVPAGAFPGRIRAERRQVIDFLFSTFEETVQLDGALSRSSHSLELLYRLADGLNRCTSERDVVAEALVRGMELPDVGGAWIEIGPERRVAGRAGAWYGPATDVVLRGAASVLGRMHLLGPEPGALDAEVLEGIGNQIGAALERALLQEALERRVEERTAALSAEVESRRRAEEAVREMAAIVEAADDGMVRQGADGRIETWNPGAMRLYGYAADEAIGRSIELVVPAERLPETREMLRRVAAGASVQGHETVRVRHDGSEIDVSLTLSPVRDAAGAVVGVAEIARDITTAKQLERQLLQAQKLESVGRLAGGIAHDFNNLMTAVIGFGELALNRMAEDDPLRGYLREITRAGERATALTQRLLAFARRQVLRPELLDVDAVVAELEALLGRLIGDDIELGVALATGGATVKADRGQLEQVVMNLALNARDAMPGGGRVTIATRAEDDRVLLTVSDTGVGMDAATQAQAFEPFFTTKPEGEGTGLGLSTAFGIVRQSGGTLSVESAPGQGTTFTVSLPRSAQAGAFETPAQGGECILVVEDEESVRSLVRRVLEGAGYAVEAAAAPEQALALDGHRYDLLITDLLMPAMSGRDLAGRLRAEFPALRVLYISGLTGDTPPDRAPGERFLSKPFSPQALCEHVRAVLDGG